MKIDLNNKLFADMTSLEKLEHIKSLKKELRTHLSNELRTPLADIWDWNDYWIPWMIGKLQRNRELLNEAIEIIESKIKYKITPNLETDRISITTEDVGGKVVYKARDVEQSIFNSEVREEDIVSEQWHKKAREEE